MPYQLIDFDEKLAEYMHSWMQAHRGDYQKIEEMEADVPAATIRWLNEPAGWLGGKAPGRYFDDFSDGAELTALLPWARRLPWYRICARRWLNRSGASRPRRR